MSKKALCLICLGFSVTLSLTNERVIAQTEPSRPAQSSHQKQEEVVQEGQTKVEEAEQRLKEERETYRRLRTTVDGGPDNDAALSFVEGGMVSTKGSVTAVLNRNESSFRVPITAVANLGGAFGPGNQFLAGSQLDATFTPISASEVQTETLPGAFSTKLDTTFSRAFRIGYKFTIRGPDDIDESKYFKPLQETLFNVIKKELTPNSTDLIAPKKKKKFLERLNEGLDDEILKQKNLAARKLKVSGKLNYTWNVLERAPDTLSATLSLETGGHLSLRHPVTFTWNLGWGWSPEDSGTQESFFARSAFSVAVALQSNLQFAFQTSFNQFYGPGFSGIPGVSDPSQHNEVNLSQTLTAAVSSKQLLAFLVSQRHLATGDVDLGVAVGYGISF